MPIGLGANAIDKAYLGSDELSQLYLGADPLLDAGLPLIVQEEFNGGAGVTINNTTPEISVYGWRWPASGLDIRTDGNGAAYSNSVGWNRKTLVDSGGIISASFPKGRIVAELVPGFYFLDNADQSIFPAFWNGFYCGVRWNGSVYQLRMGVQAEIFGPHKSINIATGLDNPTMMLTIDIDYDGVDGGSSQVVASLLSTNNVTYTISSDAGWVAAPPSPTSVGCMSQKTVTGGSPYAGLMYDLKLYEG